MTGRSRHLLPARNTHSSDPLTAMTTAACQRTARVSLLGIAILAGACRQPAPPPEQKPAPEPVARAARVFVSNETAGTVAVIDPASGAVEHTIAVGKRPRGIRLSRDGKQLLVALSGSPIAPPGVDESKLPPPDRAADGIGLVDLATRTLVRTYDSGQDPEAFDLSLDGRTLYVSNEETAEMSVIDLQSGTLIKRVPVGEEPEGVTTRPDGAAVYVTCEAINAVVGVDTKTFAVIARIPTAPRPRSIVFTPDGATMFVTGETGNAVSVVDVATHKVAKTITLPASPGAPTPPRPMGAVLAPDGTQVLVSNGRATSVSILDVASRSLVRTIENVGTRPWGIGVSPDGRKVYTANGPSGDVSIVDLATGAVDRRVALGGSPWGVAVEVGSRK